MTYKIDRLFGSRTRVVLLTKLLMEPSRTYYLRELSAELGVPYSMLHKEKENLVGLGVLLEEKRGKVNLLHVNSGLPYYAELRGLIMKTSGTAWVLGESLRGLGGIRYALIYGSVAAGGEGPASDVDLLVVGEVDEESLLRAVAGAEGEIGREVNYILWGVEEFRERCAAGNHLLREISIRPIVMVVGDEDEFRRTAKG